MCRLQGSDVNSGGIISNIFCSLVLPFSSSFGRGETSKIILQTVGANTE